MFTFVQKFFPKKQTYSHESIIVVATLTFLVALMGGLLTDTGAWYDSLPAVALQPPKWLFGPVWLILFVLIAWSAVLVWNNKSKEKYLTLFMYGVNAVLNVFWVFLFFTLKSVSGAFMEIVVLWLSIFLMIFFSHKINKKAAWLLVPYFIWVGFALYLNYNFWLAAV